MITCVSFFICLLSVSLVNAKLNRIIGGDVAHPGQFKYQILVEDDKKKKCSGVIIADQYVLTAAHCVVDCTDLFYMSKYHVVAGSTNMRSDEGVKIDVEKMYVPSEYTTKGKRNDIAVLKLKRGLDLCSNPNLQKVDLPPSRESSYIGRPAVVSGYGFNYVAVRYNPYIHREEEYDGRSDGKLRYVVANVITNEECTSQRRKYKIDENQICAQAVQREGQTTGICTGDSGGPLVIDNILIGIASISPIGCKEDNAAGIYTRISNFLDFIEKAMKDANTDDLFVHEIDSDASSSYSN